MKSVSSLENRDFYSLKNSGVLKQNSQQHVKQSADGEEKELASGLRIRHFPLTIKKKVEAEVESPLIQVLEPQGQLKNESNLSLFSTTI